MRVLFLGDIVGNPGRLAIKQKLKDQIIKNKIEFVIANGENAADEGVGITKIISENLFNCGIDVITTGNHVWDQKETASYINTERRLLRPFNLIKPSPGNGFEVYNSKNGFKIGVLNLMGNVFMKKCDNVFDIAKEFLLKKKLKKDYDFLFVDFHGEITSEKTAMGHFFDGKATLLVGTHTHIPTNDARILNFGTAYQTDAGMCGDYDSVIGMNKENSLKRFLKEDSKKHFPAEGTASLSGVIVDCDKETGLAKNVESFIYGGDLKNTH
tara:strand:- start:305 stop:1111 length:807 start_codon:yes stop_codon:yes gene_type:complete